MIKIWEPAKPTKDPFPISEEGFSGLQKKYPGRFAKYSTVQEITITEVKKKEVVVEEIKNDPVREFEKKIGDKVKKKRTYRRDNSNPA